MENEPSIFQQSVSEADIDWIVCIELNSSSSFRDWFAVKAFGSQQTAVHLGSWRSVSNAMGESDILWLTETDAGVKRLVLVENKIKAPAQPEQLQRYGERGRRYVKEGIAGTFEILLIAPKDYTSSESARYVRRLSYEEMETWFRSVADERHQFYANVFAVGAGRAVKLAAKDPDITAFRQAIWRMARDDFPELKWKDPGEVSASMYWVEESYGGFWLKYKMFRKAGVFGKCSVDLELPGRAKDVEHLKAQFGAELAAINATVTATGGSAAFSINVPPCSTTLSRRTRGEDCPGRGEHSAHVVARKEPVPVTPRLRIGRRIVL